VHIQETNVIIILLVLLLMFLFFVMNACYYRHSSLARLGVIRFNNTLLLHNKEHRAIARVHDCHYWLVVASCIVSQPQL
jgi:hypothetical protein